MSDPEGFGRAVMGVVMIALSILGAIIAKNAVDLPMTVFGCLLLAFGVCYVIGLLRQHFNAIDRAHAKARDLDVVGGKA